MTSPEMGDTRREFKDREADCIPMLVLVAISCNKASKMLELHQK